MNYILFKYWKHDSKLIKKTHNNRCELRIIHLRNRLHLLCFSIGSDALLLPEDSANVNWKNGFCCCCLRLSFSCTVSSVTIICGTERRNEGCSRLVFLPTIELLLEFCCFWLFSCFGVDRLLSFSNTSKDGENRY